MNELRQDFLAGAALAEQQDREVELGHLHGTARAVGASCGVAEKKYTPSLTSMASPAPGAAGSVFSRQKRSTSSISSFWTGLER